MSDRMIVVRLAAVGCLDNALPVAEVLQEMEENVYLFIDPGSIAAERYAGDLPRIDIIPDGCTVFSCLPLGIGFEAIQTMEDVRIILIHENASDPMDERALAWFAAGNKPSVVAVLTEAQAKMHGPWEEVGCKLVTTGLPAMDKAALAIDEIDRDEVLARVAVSEQNYVTSVALPGDLKGCLRMLDLIELGKDKLETIICRSHPKLKRDTPDHFDIVANRVDELTHIPLEVANTKIGPLELMAIANILLGTHDTTMLWQGAATGAIDCYVIPPPSGDVAKWVLSSPLTLGGYAHPFLGIGELAQTEALDSYGDSAGMIAELALNN